MSSRVDLTVRPTPDQLQRFRALTPAERYRWYVGVLTTTHQLATPEAKERWRALKQAQGGGFLAVVSAFAAALDRADFEGASRCLSAACTYEIGEAVVEGVDAIVDAYSANHRRATRAVERIRYRSSVEGTAPGVAVVTFEDRLEHRGQRHRYRCRQEMHVGRSKLVERIVHQEVDTERQALETFFASVGIRR
ncbi:MAG: hypothetical protein KF894_00855 [Labilithrix sp.]|nr:hypothetical protein [Labilithrix sp.]